ncbi:hypothetical protein [Myceligenerans pegani]|uniref:DUF4375 domain-containing protein n=1 Tax=Myceligenerans pegani TaxID=2776917 RepID=A0ABR9MX43_9MICO|nr:hypothetical protein [Myceligenerans sp. TRM 65318]MBE1875943.1 hypothetical protein [Myceligenerans sp. TRM 65318]MBE3018214.1 hypothetical protein [Myceligenerans sp. TRM 65318]
MSAEEVACAEILLAIDPLIDQVRGRDARPSVSHQAWNSLSIFITNREFDDGISGRAAWLEDKLGLGWYVYRTITTSSDALKYARDCLSAAWSNMGLLTDDARELGWSGVDLGDAELASQLDDIDRLFSYLERDLETSWEWTRDASDAFRIVWERG